MPEKQKVNETHSRYPLLERKESMSKKIVTYFSAGGNTRTLAKTLAEAAGAELYEIRPELLTVKLHVDEPVIIIPREGARIVYEVVGSHILLAEKVTEM